MDFDEDEGIPKFVLKNSFQIASNVLATIFLLNENRNFTYGYANWYALVVDRYIPSDMFDFYPEASRPTTNEQKFFYGRHMLWDFTDWPWDAWDKRVQAKGEIPSELISLGRSAYRECIQHTWDDELQLFCGLYDQGNTLEQMLLKWPEKTEKVLNYLMETDGGIVNLEN